jgi:predicted O-linked N-acetylglucosamine transferase (SPINDLY family)
MTARPDRVLGEAIASLQAGRLDDAERQFRAILRDHPHNPVALDLLGAVCAQRGRWTEAEEYLTAAIAAGAKLETTFYNYGRVLKELGRPAEAIAQFDRAIASNPRSAEAHFEKAMCLLALNRYDAVQAQVEQALAIDPNLVPALVWLGHLFSEFERTDEAFGAYERALAVDPQSADAWHGRAKLLRRQRRYPEALAAFNKALSINPGLTEVWLDRGRMFLEGKQYDAAAASFAAAVQLDPDALFAKGSLQHVKMVMCDWRDFDAAVQDIERGISAGKPVAHPVTWLALSDSGRSHQMCAENYNRRFFPATGETRPGMNQGSDKLRIGYVSAEFRDHATTHLLVGVLENHDRSRFEIHAFDNGADDGSEYRARVLKAVDGVVDVSRLGAEPVVEQIRAKGIDILVDLSGYFGLGRTDVFARRAAPLQVNYLGFPGTLGADYIDYIVADRYVIPETDRSLYDEKVVYLPGCYQPNDAQKAISGRAVTRADANLPEGAVVFCSFNKIHKILPFWFDAWMRILRAVEGSVLWLFADNAAAQANLRREAAARNVDPGRLIFAQHVAPAEHLARHRLADLFLDTLPYNAHTTASDALWAGLPLLTQSGSSFPARVAGSLLKTIGLPQLVVETSEQYERLAIELGRDRERLAAIRADLAEKRLTSPLFDTAAYTRGLERAFEMMAERQRAGLAPDHLIVG